VLVTVLAFLLSQQRPVVLSNGDGGGVVRTKCLLKDAQRTHEVGDRLLMVQDLGPPLPNRTGSLSLHPALTESPTFDWWIRVVCQIRET
jgi:hypothetical protein